MKRDKRSKSSALPFEPITHYADYQPNWSALIPPLRRGQFLIEDAGSLSIHGDAPKCFLRAKEWRKGLRNMRPRTWPKYIAKVGSKWYPVESVTEHLITRIGELAGIKVAESKLLVVGRQVRFLSRYFLGRDESLVHGIEIFRDQHGDEVVEEVASKRMEREFYTFQTVRFSIEQAFPNEASSILRELIRMLAFDALVGNNDRHPANWGVIESVMTDKPARFSPVFDTARALFWNDSEEKIRMRLRDANSLKSYLQKSSPQVGWDGEKNLNHVQLMARLARTDSIQKEILSDVFDSFCPDKCAKVLNEEFNEVLSSDRILLIDKYLRLRKTSLLEAIH